MEARVALGVEAGEEGQADGAEPGEEDGQRAQGLLADRGVRGQAAFVPEQSVGDEGRVEEDGGEHAADHKQRFDLGGAYV